MMKQALDIRQSFESFSLIYDRQNAICHRLDSLFYEEITAALST